MIAVGLKKTNRMIVENRIIQITCHTEEENISPAKSGKDVIQKEVRFRHGETDNGWTVKPCQLTQIPREQIFTFGTCHYDPNKTC